MQQAHPCAPIDAIRRAWHLDPAVRPHAGRFSVASERGCLVVRGEAPDIAVKRRAITAAATCAANTRDCVTVSARQPMSDRDIAALLYDSFAHEPVLHGIALRNASAREPDRADVLCFEVADGIVTLRGTVPGLDCKRLAGALAWWIPGTRDVFNALSVTAADTFDSLPEAVRLVLEKDPCIDAARIRIGAIGSAVTLAGALSTADQKHLAELDAWYVFGVDKVSNRILVRR